MLDWAGFWGVRRCKKANPVIRTAIVQVIGVFGIKTRLPCPFPIYIEVGLAIMLFIRVSSQGPESALFVASLNVCLQLL